MQFGVRSERWLKPLWPMKLLDFVFPAGTAVVKPFAENRPAYFNAAGGRGTRLLCFSHKDEPPATMCVSVAKRLRFVDLRWMRFRSSKPKRVLAFKPLGARNLAWFRS